MTAPAMAVRAAAEAAAVSALRRFSRSGGETHELRLVGDLEVSVTISRHDPPEGPRKLLTGPAGAPTNDDELIQQAARALGIVGVGLVRIEQEKGHRE